MPEKLTTSLPAVIARLGETLGVQQTIASDWLWGGATVADWLARQAEFNMAPIGTAPNQRPSLAAAKGQALANEALKRDALDAGWNDLHTFTLVVVGALRAKAMTDPTLRSLVDELSARGDGRRAIQDEAEELLSAWDAYDPAWSPETGYTLAILTTKIDAMPQKDRDHRAARSAKRLAEAKLRSFAIDTENQLMAWYEAATARWAEGTPHGNTIRGQITTSYSPAASQPSAPTTAPAGLTAAGAGDGRVALYCLDVLGADRFRWWVKGAGETAFTQRGETLDPAVLLANLPAGPAEVQVAAVNAGGEGPRSAAVAVVVP